jgi:NAD(P)-dependent dehydrogenase (short-subunit alcohol dehydrogenase family)
MEKLRPALDLLRYTRQNWREIPESSVHMLVSHLTQKSRLSALLTAIREARFNPKTPREIIDRSLELKQFQREKLLSKKTFVVTGSTGRIGAALAELLADFGANLVITARDADKGKHLRETITTNTKNQNVALELLNLSDQSSINIFANRLSQEYPRIDFIINNAAITPAQFYRSSENNTSTIMRVNYLGTVLSTLLLLPLLEEAGSFIIADVSAYASHKGSFERLTSTDLLSSKRTGKEAYADSKLALDIFSRGLARRIGNEGTVFSIHPGEAWGIAESFPLLERLLLTPEEAALGIAEVILFEKPPFGYGRYEYGVKSFPPEQATDTSFQLLWQKTLPHIEPLAFNQIDMLFD